MTNKRQDLGPKSRLRDDAYPCFRHHSKAATLLHRHTAASLEGFCRYVAGIETVTLVGGQIMGQLSTGENYFIGEIIIAVIDF